MKEKNTKTDCNHSDHYENQNQIEPPKIDHNQKKQNKPKLNLTVLIWVLTIGWVIFLSYNQYTQKQSLTPAIIINAPDYNQSSTENQHEHSTKVCTEEIVEIADEEIENEYDYEPVSKSEPQETWYDCNICNGTGTCQMCWGNSRCGVCGGTGNQYLFGDWTNCSNCSGSGWCQSCQGSGFCFACNGRGRCQL